ncbi:hypothetical protein CGMCC3_g12115 [Colletotrichum fructicola]|nr:uncharacterized protein CGMCC3_g12115 [Colletotrichum fructicola]KAE9571785.1 hypothetical protein CGMCC3_g12115 [Colletotrichum fructicola]
MDLGLDLEGTIVVVTGAGGQIGQVIVEAFLKAGCFVAAIDIDDSRLKRQHDNLLPMECDTTDERSVFSAWSAVAMRFGSWPTVCVCAAALDLSFVKHHASITEMSAEQFRKTLDVNVTGTFITAKAWLSHIPRADGSSLVHLNSDQNFSLIIIGSEAGIMVVPGNPDYASSKSAVQYGLMLSLAPDAVRINPGVRVNAICPGAVDTPMFRNECADDKTGSTKWIESEATVASKRPVDAEDVARQCLILASHRWSASTNGQMIRLDGGKSGRTQTSTDCLINAIRIIHIFQQVAKREATSVTMGFGCGFDIYPRLEATDSNIEKYGFLIRSTILKYEDVYDDDSRHPEGRVLDIATESGSHFGTNYNLSFLVGEIPRMPVDADRCNNYFLRFSSKVQRVAHSSS